MIANLLLSTLLLISEAQHLAPTQADYQKADSITICQLLNEARTLPATTNHPLHFARKFLGRPYVAHTLETGQHRERLIVNTRQFDCTTLVETVTALSLCARRQQYTWHDYLHTLLLIRYRGGHIEGYPSRLHYFSDWIEDNTQLGIINEAQWAASPFTAIQTLSLNYMSSHPASYQALKKHPRMIPIIASQERALQGKQYRYIPKAAVKDTPALRRAVSDGDIIAITTSKKGLDIAHLGFAVWRADGLHLLNTSQLHSKVVEEPMTLGEYLKKHPSHTGIRILRIMK